MLETHTTTVSELQSSLTVGQWVIQGTMYSQWVQVGHVVNMFSVVTKMHYISRLRALVPRLWARTPIEPVTVFRCGQIVALSFYVSPPRSRPCLPTRIIDGHAQLPPCPLGMGENDGVMNIWQSLLWEQYSVPQRNNGIIVTPNICSI